MIYLRHLATYLTYVGGYMYIPGTTILHLTPWVYFYMYCTMRLPTDIDRSRLLLKLQYMWLELPIERVPI